MGWKSLDDMELDGKRVLLRVDINVPVENGRVTDATRIERIVPTVTDILSRGGKVTLLAHFGRPKGKVVDEMSLKQVLPALEKALGRDVAFVSSLDAAAEAQGDLQLMENIRFYPGEEANDEGDGARRERSCSWNSAAVA